VPSGTFSGKIETLVGNKKRKKYNLSKKQNYYKLIFYKYALFIDIKIVIGNLKPKGISKIM
jgi:hypothetical protein